MRDCKTQALRAFPSPWALFFLIFVFAIGVRFFLFGFQTDDFTVFLTSWLQHLDRNGFSGLKEPFSNYAPFYTYLLLISTKLPIPWLWSVKLWSVLFDCLLSYFCYRIVRLRGPNSHQAARFAAAAVLVLPTVVINSSMWGQCDSIYSTLVMASIYFLLKEKPICSCLLWAFAFSIKPQSIFFLPILWSLSWRNPRFMVGLLLCPVIYILISLPALIAGRSLIDLVIIYFSQPPAQQLSLYAPNLYSWIPDNSYATFYRGGLVFAGVSAICFTIALAKAQLRNSDNGFKVKASLVSVLLIPLLLPEMHERYFYLADILSLVFAFYFPSKFYLPLIIQFTSLFSYLPYLLKVTPIPVEWLGVVNTLTCCILIFDLFGGKPIPERDQIDSLLKGSEL